MEYEAGIRGRPPAESAAGTLVEGARSLPTSDALPKNGTESLTGFSCPCFLVEVETFRNLFLE